MVFGTFDLVHPGHEHFFRQARAQARGQTAFLIVSVARDKNVQRIKGRKPLHSEKKRLAVLKSHPLVDRAILGGLVDHLPHIIKQKPDVIALGYDQQEYVKGLKTGLKHKGLQVKIVRLKPHQPRIYKSSLLKKT
jgi:FAD synthetase